MTDAASPFVTRIAEMTPADREAVRAILRETGQFREKEVVVALELFDAAFGLGELKFDPDYKFLGAYAANGVLLGYATYGPTPGTDRTWDLYWIAVAIAARGHGVGSRLLAEVESLIAAEGARLLLVETSSRTDYGSTRGFYASRGYTEQARIRDYYEPDDDRLMLTKSLAPGAHV